MANLSPSAQAVLDAFICCPVETSNQLALAAALRAIAQELRYVGITERNILAIADELEGVKYGTYRCDLEAR